MCITIPCELGEGGGRVRGWVALRGLLVFCSFSLYMLLKQLLFSEVVLNSCQSMAS